MTRSHYEALCTDLPTEATFRAAHPVACTNDQRLDAGFMAEVCNRPPARARFRGWGSYYQPCGDGTRIDADWFDTLCANPPDDAAYTASGRYFEMCSPPRKVAAEWFQAYCADLPEAARYTDSGRYELPCAAPHALRVEFLEAQRDMALRDQPAAIVWPPAGAEDIPPAFFLEEPDPLPDQAVAGNPVSLQVNPAFADRVELQRFALYRVAEGSRSLVEPTRLLDADSDPNGLLTAYEFALFPLQRLDWGTRYEVLLEMLLDGRPQRLSWQFSTRDGAAEVLTAARDNERFVVRSGEPVWLYLPPREAQSDTVLRSRTSYRRGNQVAIKPVDANTVEITVEAKFCDRVTVTFEPKRVVELVPAGCPG